MQRSNLWIALLFAACLGGLGLGLVKVATGSATRPAQDKDQTGLLLSELWGEGQAQQDGIGVVKLSGVIQFGASEVGPFAAQSPAEAALAKLRSFADEDRVKAVVLQVNSPGGSLAASQAIAAQVQRLVAAKKPVVVSMGDVAASGGYYIAAGASKIFAHPGTITASIGVISSGLNLSELMQRHGVAMNVYTSGANKDMMAYWRTPRAEEQALLQKLVDDAYGQFFDAVAKQRNLAPEKLRPYADGRIMLGSEAMERGLVDALGGFDDALRAAAELAGLDPDDPHIIRDLRPWLQRVQMELGALTSVRPRGMLPSGALLGATLNMPVAYLYLPPLSAAALGAALSEVSP